MFGGQTLVLVLLLAQRGGSFNLDVENPSDVLIGAPRANTSGSVVERGAVYSCPWKNSAACQTLDFDSSDFRVELLLDRLKQKEATKRVLFLHGQTFSYSKNMVVSNGRGPACEEQHVYLRQIYIGDDNALTLKISAENQGEGAYEAELHIYLPQQADFTGVGRGEALSRLSCAYKTENQTKMVVCDLGNPMKGGTKVLAELQFSVHQLSEEDTSVKFDLQIVSSNQFNNTSPRVSSVTKLAVLARVSIRGTSSPGQVLLPIANWKPKVPPQLLNSGPSTFSKASLEVKWPYQFKNGSLLYITSYETEGPINCTTDTEINPLNISVRHRHFSTCRV
ncbi:Integrin alpha-V [Collichthys lucidus]|uniref:Integrin alpha-V n=1 Tax=Collichthys lucidus TaxID=240159 RepID=A0A4U5TZ17_COLLU|nr:Integrin alpha-V [Collichthys lucidus]